MNKWTLYLGAVLLFFAEAAFSDHTRLSIALRYRGELLHGTFFSKILPWGPTDDDDSEFLRAARFLDGMRMKNYISRNGRKKLPPEVIAKWKTGFFDLEPLQYHDEILVLHRGPLSDGTNLPAGFGAEILGMIAVDRLGDTFLDCLPGFNNKTYEELLLEKRLRALGLKIPRPRPAPWLGPGLPVGVYPHWHPWVREQFFAPNRLLWGDVIQANGLFAKEGLWPLLHSLANFYGLFSTGRIIPHNRIKTIGDLNFQGPFVAIPTLVVWEVFNERRDGVVREGSRTRYYENARATPLNINGVDQWQDPRFPAGDVFVQIAHKSGNEFREGWTDLFQQQERFSFVRDVEILETVLESMDGKELLAKKIHDDPRFAYHPRHLGDCIDELWKAVRNPPVQHFMNVQISIGAPYLNPPQP